jgi:hypothetical protein
LPSNNDRGARVPAVAIAAGVRDKGAMRRRFRPVLGRALGLALVLVPVLIAANVAGARVIPRSFDVVCESHGRRDAWCPTPQPIGRVELRDRLSSARCVKYETWGWSASGIWVTGGCRARFRVTPAGYAESGHGRGGGRIVRCESVGDRPARCRLDFPIGRAEVHRRLSDAPCERGYSWGVDDRAIWVDQGCRADFLVFRR